MSVSGLEDLLLGEVQREHVFVMPRRLNRVGDHEHLATGQPPPGVDDQIAQAPRLFVEIQVVNGADRPVTGIDRFAQ